MPALRDTARSTEDIRIIRHRAARTQTEADMSDWLKRIRDAFRAWCNRNAEAHAKATPRACCSGPPPGAGSHDAKTGH